MSYTEVEQLRKSGNLDEAYEMAITDLKMASQGTGDNTPLIVTATEDEPEEEPHEDAVTLGKRAMAWVLYEFMKQNTAKEDFETFMDYLREFINLELDPDEKMVVNQLVWVIGKVAFEYTKDPDFDQEPMDRLAEIAMTLNFSKQSKGYSFLFKAMHKALKDSPRYIDFASWWDLRSFIRDDYKFTKQDDGKRIMAVAEQGCNRYSKQLIRAMQNADDEGTREYIREKIDDFLPIVEDSIQHNRHYRKLPYYQVKLLLTIGDTSAAYRILKSKARDNQEEFWVWELLAEAFDDESEKQIACLCSAMMCRSKPVKIFETRLKLTNLLIIQEYYNEAKTEIAQLLRCCFENKWDIPEEVTEWGDQKWYASATVAKNNHELYESYMPVADEIIFGDIAQRKVVVENVNHEKSILNFIGLDYEKGYCKFNKSLRKVKAGDVLLVRIKSTGFEGRYNLLSAKILNEKYLEGILKHFAGEVIKPTNKAFAFIDGMFVTPEVCSKYRLDDGEYVTGKAMISYNKKKEEWGWKVISIDS